MTGGGGLKTTLGRGCGGGISGCEGGVFGPGASIAGVPGGCGGGGGEVQEE